MITDSFKVLFLFPLFICSKYHEHVSYVNTDKRNLIHINIQTQRIKLEEVSVSQGTKSHQREIKNKERNLLDESSKDTLLSKANNNDIWKWHANDFCGYLKLNALSLSFAIYNILNNRGKCQNLNQEKISVGRKRIFKKISLLFFGVNVNVLIRTNLQTLWNMLQPLRY